MDEQVGKLLALIGQSSPPFDDFIKHVANGGLRRYKAIIHTEGPKAGESLYTHALSGVSVLEVVREPLGLTDPEARCLFLAYSVHDLNKVIQGGDKIAYKDLATEGNVARELEAVGADQFFPDWRTYLVDIAALCRLHQGHLAVDMTGADRRERFKYQLGWDRLELLGHLMRGADVLDLSDGLEETKHKDSFIRAVNAASGRSRFRFIHHRLSENRGILTNLIHHTVATYLHARLGARPLLCYPEGTAYLITDDATTEWTAADNEALAGAVERALREVQGEALDQFIGVKPAGFKVDRAAVESGATFATIMAMIRERIVPRTYPDRWRWGDGANPGREQNVRQDLEAALPSLPDAKRTEVERLLMGASLLPSDDRLRVGELASAYRNLLDDHLSKQVKAKGDDAWQRVYRLLDLPPGRRPIYDAVNGFRRAYFISRDTVVGLDDLSARIERDLVELGTDEGDGRGGGFVAAYLRANLTLFFTPPGREDFSEALARYTADQHQQCCYCGSALPTQEWMAANVPPNIGVQFFSNRLAGGGGEPKRRVCPLCRTQFILERLGWTSHRDKRGDEQGTFYVHLFPYTFFTEPFLDAWREEAQRLLTEDSGAFFIDTRTWLRERSEGESPPIRISQTKVNGVALPRISRTISNTPVLALNAPGKTYSAQLLMALQHAVVLAQFFGCRLILSRTAVPILPADAFNALLVDGVPTALEWLVHGRRGRPESEDDLDTSGVERLIERLQALHALQRLLYDRGRERNLILEFARAASDNPLAVFFVADRAIEEKANEPQRATLLAKDCAPYLEQLVEEPMTQLKTLAQMAVDDFILGGSGPFGRRPRSALLKPFDIVFSVLEQHPPPQWPLDDICAAATDEVFSHLHRIASADRKPGATKAEKVERYVRHLVNSVLGELYGNDMNRFVADERFVRSAYVQYVRDALAARRGGYERLDEPIDEGQAAE